MQSSINHILILCFIALVPFLGMGQTEDYIPGEVIIQFKRTVVANNRVHNLAKKIDTKYQLGKVLYAELGIYLVTFDPTLKMSSVLRELSYDDDILYVQKNQKVSPRTTEPNDPFFVDQWYHNTIESASAWDITTGGKDARGREIVIAVLDSGFDIQHEDFGSNLWTNDDEIPNDNIDNDNNGYVDDFHGWNPKEGNDNHASTGQGTLHGTNVAGLAGAKGNNNIGISGVVWDVKLLLLSNLDSAAEIIEANAYASETRRLYNETNGAQGAYIVASNLSLGIRGGKAEDYPIWCGLYDEMGQHGILNVGATDNLDIDVDIEGDMPSTCSSEFLIVVTNTDINNLKPDIAAFGRTSVDMSAPGTMNTTTSPNNSYNEVLGTSASAPLVAGAIALLYSAPCQSIADNTLTKPSETALTMKSIIYKGATPAPALENITSQGSVLNVWGSIQALDEGCESNSTATNELIILPNLINKDTENIEIEYVALSGDEDSYISVFDAKGALVIQTKVNRTLFGSNTITLDTQSRLSNGVYFVVMNLPDGITVAEKLVVY